MLLMNYKEIIAESLSIKMQRELENYLDEVFRNYSFIEDIEVISQFKQRVWEEIRKNSLEDEVMDYVGFSTATDEAEIGCVSHLKKPEDVYAGLLHWIHLKLKEL